MSNRTFLTFASLASLVSAAAFVACSGTDTTTLPVNDAGTDGTAQDATGDTSKNDAAADAPVAVDGGGDAGDCNSLPKDQCRACCFKAHPNVSIILTESAKCGCTTPGLCKTDCASTLCANKASDQTCTACLQSADAGNCLGVAAAACANDQDCAAGIACGQGCK